MGLRYDFNVIRKQLAALDPHERAALMRICAQIQGAQQALTEKAAPLLARCAANCKGLCCRNIHVADIVTKWDLIYILALQPGLEARLAECLVREDFFAADCLFLENGTGPCVFPEYVRPERCIISFCRVEPRVEKEIAQVMKAFGRLIRFFRCRPFCRVWKRVHPALGIFRSDAK